MSVNSVIVATVDVKSFTEFDNNADNVACDELNELRATEALSVVVVKNACDSFPLVSTSKTVVG